MKILYVTLAALALSACIGPSDDIPGMRQIDELPERIVDVEPFERITIKANGYVSIRQTGTPGLTVHTEEDHFSYLVINSDGGELVIDHDGRHVFDRHSAFFITVDDLTALVFDNVVEADVHDLHVSHLELEFDAIGDLEMSGSCESGVFDLDFIGDADLRDFECKAVEARVDSIGDARLTATETLSLTVDSIGDVDVYGSPVIRRLRTDMIGDVQIHERD